MSRTHYIIFNYIIFFLQKNYVVLCIIAFRKYLIHFVIKYMYYEFSNNRALSMDWVHVRRHIQMKMMKDTSTAMIEFDKTKKEKRQLGTRI